MKPTHTFALLLAFGYLGARLLLGRIRITGKTRHFFLLGGEYVALGAILGPKGLGIISQEALRELEPAIAMGIGWLGLLYGLQFSRKHLRRFPAGPLAAAVGFPLAVGVILFPILQVTIAVVPGVRGPLAMGALALAAAASCTSPAAIAAFARGQRTMASIAYFLRIVSSLDAMPAIVAMGVAYTVAQSALVGPVGMLGGVGGPLLLGLFTYYFVRTLSAREELLLATVGTICFAGGAAFTTSFSPLFSSFLIGVLLANLGRGHVTLLRLIVQTEKPFYIVFLIIAGARWDFAEPSYWALGLGLAVLRLVAKAIVPAIAALLVRNRDLLPTSTGLGLLGAGGVGLAIALELTLVHPSSLSDAVLAAVLVSFLVYQVVAPIGLWFLFRSEGGSARPRMETIP